MGKIISISGQKGGCGKTTVSVILASMLAYKYGKKVMVIDADTSQQSFHMIRLDDQTTIQPYETGEKDENGEEIMEVENFEIYEEFSSKGIPAYPVVECRLNVDEIINYISGIRRCQNMPEYDFQTLEKHVYNDVDHRYIFNEDKTLLRISPDHISPKYVEEELKNAGTIKIKQSVFKKNNLEFVKDETRKIIITSGNGRRWFFPYETNRIFYIDDKRFFMPVELTRGSAVAVSAYLNKHTKYSYQYRMAFIDFPAVLNYIHALNAELADYEGNTYRICIE